MAKNGSNELRDLTVAEVQSLTARYVRQRQAKVDERAEIFAAYAARGSDIPPPSDDDDADAIRQGALAMLNGHAPATLHLPPPADRDRLLRIEIGSLDLVIGALRSKELVASATEGAEWALQHGDEWVELARDYILSAVHLQAVEERMEAVRRAAPGPTGMLPLAEYLGTGRSPIGVKWMLDPMSRLREAALQQKIVTRSELEGAKYA